MALRDSLVSWWELNETSGTRNDAHGSNHLTENGTGGVGYATGKQGNAADFEKSDTDYLSITDASQTGLDLSGDFSLSFWIKMEADVNTQQAILMKDGNGANNTRSYFLAYNDNGTPQLNLILFPTGYSYPGYYNANYSYTLTSGTWYHVVIVVSISAANATKAYLYINGTGQGYFTLGDGTGATSIQNSAAAVQIGYVSHATALDGLLDEFGVWSRTLTSGEVTSLYNSGSGLTYAQTGGGVTVTPSAQVATFSIPASAYKHGSTKSPSVQVITVSAPARSVVGKAVVSANALLAAFSIPAYAVTGDGNKTVSPSAQTVTFTVPTYAVSVVRNISVAVNALVATFSTPSRTVSLGTGVTVAATVALLTLSIPAVTLTLVRYITVTVATQILTFSLPTLRKVGGVWTRISRSTSGSYWTRTDQNNT
jgi:hypothetical protein